MESKKTIIFLHGWGNSSEVFIPLSYYLKNDFCIYAPDLPGFGRAHIEKPMGLKDYADFVYKFTKDNQIENPIIIGHSFGGAVAAKLAILHSKIISKLILVGASAIRESNFKIKFIERPAKIIKKIFPKKIYPFILKFLGLNNSDYARIENPYLKETFKIVIKENLAPELPLIKVPTLVIWGEKDAETPLKYGRLITQLIPNAKLEIIKSAGHHVFLDKPLEFIYEIKKFIVSPTA
ncbi:MAG: alpha/beta hydrolase [Candidatus Azambacteria bacterium]|nr:alpha/beta hydrolase [Candidatus Azambacteria bacterium]